MIFIKENTAYIMTASCKKDDMLKNYQTFLDSFLSFQIIDDLFSLVLNKKDQTLLKQKYDNLINPKKDGNKNRNKI